MTDTETAPVAPDEETEQEAPQAPDEGAQEEAPEEHGEPAGEADAAAEAPEIDEPDENTLTHPEGVLVEPSSETQLAAMDKRATQLEKRGTNYAEAVVEYLQETQQPLVRCGFCLERLPGFFASPHVQPFTPDQLAFARAVAGLPDEPPLVQASDAHMCPECNGWGEVLTGSKRNQQKARKCFTCNGRGWEGRGAGDVPAVNGHAGEVTLGAPERAPEDVPDTDPWGRPPSHPGFYKMPHPGMPEHELPPGFAAVTG